MAKYICKNPSCQKTFEYCRGCTIVGDPYKDLGFCSKECYLEFKTTPKVQEEAQQTVDETPIQDEIVLTNEEESTSIEDVVPTTEEVMVVKPTIKNETYNTYKKNKHKYR